MLGLGIAQAQNITGKVTDATNKSSIPSASVVVKGTTRGTLTDVDGNYTIAATAGETLVFQLLGYKNQEVNVGSQSVIDVALEADASALSEVVVVGYGTQEQREITSAIVGVKAADIQNIPVPSFESALQGRTTGVQITAGSGKVGQGFNIRVRGAASLSASNEPLYVVDGIIMTQGSLNQNGEALNPLADINTNDIESIDILKDASAAAIYGARASNGVVLITTKKGKAGKGKISIGYSTGTSEATRKRGFLNRAEYLQIFRDAYKFDGYTPAETDTDLTNFFGNDWRDPAVDTDWEALAFQKARFQQLDLNASGGNERTTYFVAGSYSDQEGILAGNRMNRLSLRFNVDTKVTDKLSVGGGTMFSRNKNYRVAQDVSFANLLQIVALVPIQRPYEADGVTPNANTTYSNPLFMLTDVTDEGRIFRNLSNVYASYKILPYLSFRSELALDVSNIAEEDYINRRTPGDFGGRAGGYGSYSTTTSTNYTITNILNFNKTFNDVHSVDVLLGTSYQDIRIDISSTDATDFPSDDFRELISATTPLSSSSNLFEDRYDSYFTRGNYKFKGKYLASLSLRVDGSSRFGKDSRYGFFPAGSLGWIASDEEFIKNLNVFSFLKVRTGYGITGNAEIPRFRFVERYTSRSYGSTAGTIPAEAPNKDLRWETTNQFDTGIEFGFFKDRLSLNVDYYNKDTRGLLLAVPVPATSGFTTRFENIGRIRNRGFEFAVTSRNLIGAVKWTTTLNMSFNRNKIIDIQGQIIPAGTTRMLNQARENEPIGVMYGRKYAGVDPANGNALYYQADGTATNNYNTALIQKVGDPNPDFFGGLNNTVSYKGFELNVFAQFQYGNDLSNAAGGFMSSNMASLGDNMTKDQMNYWKQPGDITNVPRPSVDANNGGRPSSRYIYDGSYIRLKTATLAYNIPQEWLQKAKIGSARLYVTGQNLLTKVSKNFQGWDPEVNTSFAGSNVAIGNDFYTAPQARTIIFGFNIGF
jgi:TonB-linked SusC/RagA family outer membrane protein